MPSACSTFTARLIDRLVPPQLTPFQVDFVALALARRHPNYNNHRGTRNFVTYHSLFLSSSNSSACSGISELAASPPEEISSRVPSLLKLGQRSWRSIFTAVRVHEQTPDSAFAARELESVHVLERLNPFSQPKMAITQGRGNAINFLTLLASALLATLLQSTGAQAKNFNVGGDKNWDYPAVADMDYYDKWAAQQTFLPGDTLTFKYTPAAHDTTIVSEAQYASCMTSTGKKYTSGADMVTLPTAGTYYFYCSIMGHCEMGMKMKVTVAAAAAITPVTAPALAPAPAVVPPAPVPVPVKAPTPSPKLAPAPSPKLAPAPVAVPVVAPTPVSVPVSVPAPAPAPPASTASSLGVSVRLLAAAAAGVGLAALFTF